MRKAILLIGAAVAAVWFVAAEYQSDRAKRAPGETTVAAVKSRPVLSDRAVSLRDEAIRNVGWIAGNARGHPIWPEIRGFVEPGGSYYRIVQLASGHMSDSTEAAVNVALYREWVGRGESQPFNEGEAVSRIRRLRDIAKELEPELR